MGRRRGIERVIAKSRTMGDQGAIEYLSYHRLLKGRKVERLEKVIEELRGSIEMLEREEQVRANNIWKESFERGL